MAEKILIIDDDLDTLRLVGLMLQKQGYQIIAAPNGLQGLFQAEAENPDLILLDIMMPEIDGYEVAKRLRANPFTADIPILMFTAKTQLDDKVSGFESGADDYLTKPTHPSELQAHVRALLARSTKGRSAANVSGAEKKAFMIGILAPRGGLGVSTVAANLGSSMKMAAEEEADVIVVELRPGQGTLAFELGVKVTDGLTQILQSAQVDITRQTVGDALYSLENGPRFLLASAQPKDAVLMNAEAQIETLLNRIVFLAPTVIVDLGPSLTAMTQKVIKSFDCLVVIVEPSPASVVHAKALIADLVSLGVENEVILPLAVNRIRSELQMNWTQVNEQLGMPVVVAVTPVPELLYQAARLKTTAVLHQPNSLTSQQFEKLVAAILDLQKKQT
jgi:CheY-like chemotaxis protein/MinD-like ATPase involved in chromosome partitioning or flagellar assembly